MSLPTALIYINADINAAIQNKLETQLHTTETISFTEFNARVNIDPNYITNIHLHGLRILVIVPNFQDKTNRTLADVVLFYSHGLVYVEKNNFGEPGLALSIDRLNIYDLLRYNKSPYVIILPSTPSMVDDEELSETFGGGGIVQEELMAGTPGDLIEGPDEDDNEDFIHRK